MRIFVLSLPRLIGEHSKIGHRAEDKMRGIGLETGGQESSPSFDMRQPSNDSQRWISGRVRAECKAGGNGGGGVVAPSVGFVAEKLRPSTQR